MSAIVFCECSCLTARRSAVSSKSSSSARLSRAGHGQQQRTTSTSSQRRLRPARGWVLPDFQAAKRAVNLPPPRIQKFESKVLLPSGGHLTIYGTTPRPSIPITRDTATHPLWSFPSTKAARGGAGQEDEDEGGRLGRFAKKYAQAGSISREQANTAKEMGAATGGAGNTETATQAAVAAQDQVKKQRDTEKVAAKRVELVPEREDLFDLTLEGEVYVESKHKVVEESSKKGKGKAAKKGGKK